MDRKRISCVKVLEIPFGILTWWDAKGYGQVIVGCLGTRTSFCASLKSVIITCVLLRRRFLEIV